jgi:hypothetical protein
MRIIINKNDKLGTHEIIVLWIKLYRVIIMMHVMQNTISSMQAALCIRSYISIILNYELLDIQ